MTISIWRYSHLALAVSSFLFIALASVTGVILAFDPVIQKVQPYRAGDFDKITIAEAVSTIKKSYPDVSEITVDANGFLIVHATNAKGKALQMYVNPRTGKQTG